MEAQTAYNIILALIIIFIGMVFILLHPSIWDKKEKETLKTCMVCPSTDNVKRYKTKTHDGLILNSGDGYVEYCKKHAIEHGYWVE